MPEESSSFRNDSMVFVDKTSVLTPEDLNIGCSDKFVDHFDEDMVEDEVGHGHRL